MSSNNRASLLSGLRTGGVRSSVNTVPQTAAPNVSSFSRHDAPMSAIVGGSFNQYSPRVQAEAQAHMQAHSQALQMQMVQLEIMRLQALQAQQQYQIELAMQQQVQHQHHTAIRASYPVFELHGAEPAPAPANRRTSQAEFLKASLHVNSRTVEDQIPMSASLNGKFGARLNPNAAAFRMGGLSEEEEEIPRIPIASSNGYTTQPAPTNTHHTIMNSAGTYLSTANSNASLTAGVAPSKSETSLNWRRGGSSLAHNGRSTSLSVKITPPPEERDVGVMVKSRRPEPLRFSVMRTELNAPLVVVDSSDGETGEDADDGSTSSSTKSEPTTPPSSGMSSIDVHPLSPREVASKRLYEGLGIGRPIPRTAAAQMSSFAGMSDVVPQFTGGSFTCKAFSQPIRQPRGPPSGADELGPKNFATRIRRKAIGGLGAMLDARASKREVEAY